MGGVVDRQAGVVKLLAGHAAVGALRVLLDVIHVGLRIGRFFGDELQWGAVTFALRCLRSSCSRSQAGAGKECVFQGFTTIHDGLLWTIDHALQYMPRLQGMTATSCRSCPEIDAGVDTNQLPSRQRRLFRLR
jgi:hypothetical protein